MPNEPQTRASQFKEPYVGPRPFEEGDGAIFFGREQETSELVSLIISHPVVLIYSQSGAGKTSLLKASLIPALKNKRLEVFGPARVKGQNLTLTDGEGVDNVYVSNALAYLSGGSLATAQKATLKLQDALPVREVERRRGMVPLRVIVFDQFEELFTNYPEKYQERQNFFEQISTLLRNDPLARVVFAMREDYIAELDPYAQILPEKLQTRFRLLRLNEEAARVAVEKPLDKFSQDNAVKYAFDVDATDKIIDNLSTITISERGYERQVKVPYVEPVHLQVICQSLWRKMVLSFAKRIANGAREVRVTVNDVIEFGNLQEALEEFYEKSLQLATSATLADKKTMPAQVIEGKLRKWFDESLITSEGTRSIVFGSEVDQLIGGIPIAAVRELENQRLINAELRGGRIWYELSHDRFIKPIKNSNETWFQSQAKKIERASSILNTESILFDNNNKASLVKPSLNHTPEEILSKLNVSPFKALFVVLADPVSRLQPNVSNQVHNLSMALAKAAIEMNAIIVDSGLASGLVKSMGECVSGLGNKSTLLGIAPESFSTYPGSKSTSGIMLDQNHSHFVLVEGNTWGSETSAMMKLISALRSRSELAGSVSNLSLPACVVLFGGGNVEKNKVLAAVRQGIPVLLVEESGGLAGEILGMLNASYESANDPVLAEIINDGDLRALPVYMSAKAAEQAIVQLFGVDKVLQHAWETFALYDLNANIQQKRYRSLRAMTIWLSVLMPALAVIHQICSKSVLDRQVFGGLWEVSFGTLLSLLLIVIAIAFVVCLMAANRFRTGEKWLFLRAGAEALKREIYCYRARIAVYNWNAENQLAKKVESLTQRIMRTEVNLAALRPYNKDKGFPPVYGNERKDDGFSLLKPERYVDVRLGDQLAYFQHKTPQLEKQIKYLNWGIFIAGGLGIFFTALNGSIWLVLTTAMVSAFTMYLGQFQIENTLIRYNQLATDLSNIKAWWNSLTVEEQSNRRNFESLVVHTEGMLQRELDGWTQQLQDPLTALRNATETVAVSASVADVSQYDAAEPEAKPYLGTTVPAPVPDVVSWKYAGESIDKNEGTASAG